MGVKLLPARLYRSEVASRESLRETLLLVELDTARERKKRLRKHSEKASQSLCSWSQSLTRRAKASESRAQANAEGSTGTAEAQRGGLRRLRGRGV